MRHSSPVLTANVYTDPRLLDVHGAVESLPALTSARPETETCQATGTADDGFRKLAPLLAKNSDPVCISRSIPVTSDNLGNFDPAQIHDEEISEKPTKKARILTEKDSGHQSGRHDLNMLLPAPKAGALPS